MCFTVSAMAAMPSQERMIAHSRVFGRAFLSPESLQNRQLLKMQEGSHVPSGDFAVHAKLEES